MTWRRDPLGLPLAHLVAGLVIAFGLALAGYFVSDTLYKARNGANTVTVKGLAEREVQADLATWYLPFTVTGGELGETYGRAEAARGNIVGFLKENGFKDEEILTPGVQVSDLMAESYTQGQMREDGRYIIKGQVGVRTRNVGQVERLVQATGALIERGVVLTNNAGPRYEFTQLNAVKPEMLREATANAREAAEQFARDSGVAVRGIANAQQGLFTIEGTERNDMTGMTDGSLTKKVRVVTTVTFYIE